MKKNKMPLRKINKLFRKCGSNKSIFFQILILARIDAFCLFFGVLGRFAFRVKCLYVVRGLL